MKEYYAGIEAGGTEFVCLIGTSPDHLIDEKRFPTTDPDETMARVIEFFAPYVQRDELKAVGIASFGPVDLDRNSKTYGYITNTPKTGWEQVDLRGRIKRGLKVPVVMETDVNAAAFGEQYWILENQKLLDPFLYMYVGNGIGVGAIINGAPLHGLIHPEAGHFAIPHNWQRDPFPGVCPYHNDCLEGLASEQAMRQRWNQDAKSLPEEHPAWDLEADYIACALVNLIYAYSPRRIILGGEISEHPGLHQAVRRKVQQLANGYVLSKMVLENIDSYILPPILGDRSRVLGALALAITEHRLQLFTHTHD